MVLWVVGSHNLHLLSITITNKDIKFCSLHQIQPREQWSIIRQPNERSLQHFSMPWIAHHWKWWENVGIFTTLHKQFGTSRRMPTIACFSKVAHCTDCSLQFYVSPPWFEMINSISLFWGCSLVLEASLFSARFFSTMTSLSKGFFSTMSSFSTARNLFPSCDLDFL